MRLAAIACLLAALTTGANPHVSRTHARAAAASDWTQFGWDLARSSYSTTPTGIDARNVGALHRQKIDIDGIVDASAIYLHGARVGGAAHDVLFVTTSYGKTLAIDARSGTVLWRYTPSEYRSWAGSAQVTTSTPVADPDREHIYAASPDGRIHKLAVADGRELWSTAITKDAHREKIASPLAYHHGRVIAVTGGYIGDAPSYQGHVAVLDASTGKLLHVWNSLCSDHRALIEPRSCSESGSAIWGRAGAVIDSATGEIFVATGNGKWDGRTNWGDAVIVLDSLATTMLANYTPSNTGELESSDADVGSSSPVLLGGGFIAQGGKDGRLRVLELSQIRGTEPHRGGERQGIETRTARFTAPAVMRTESGTWLFTADHGGTAAWRVMNGQLRSAWNNDHAGTSPVIAGGLLYVYDPDGKVRVYEPESGRDVATLDCGEGHWNSPIVVDGLIVIPEGSSNDHDERGTISVWRVR